MRSSEVVVMGIDPGVANTGFGVVRAEGNSVHALDGGVIEAPPSESMPERLERIHSEIGQLLAWHEPIALALEDLFFGRNARSAMAVGQARGVAQLAAAQHGIPCFDYTPQAIKLAVCGTGAAAKGQVQHMVGSLLGLPSPPKSDHAADALAVAICHSAHARTGMRAAAARSGASVATR